MSFGVWTIECSHAFTAAELAEAVADVSETLELRFVGALGRAQAGFVDAAMKPEWIHLTFWEPQVTGLVLTIERDVAVAPPFVVKVETEVATDLFADDAQRRVAVGDLAGRVVDRMCERLRLRVVGFESAS